MSPNKVLEENIHLMYPPMLHPYMGVTRGSMYAWNESIGLFHMGYY